MQVLRQNHIEKMGGSTPGSGASTSSSSTSNTPPPAQGLTALLVMIAVLCMLLAYCFWGAAWCRAFCRRRVCCLCPMDEPEGFDSSGSIGGPGGAGAGEAATPTIILLPFGRMLVVDGAVLAQLHAEARGLDLLELGERVVRTQRLQTGSTPSILHVDSETTSKGVSPLLEALPPAYEAIFGSRVSGLADLPPSYSEVSLQARLARAREDFPAIDDDVEDEDVRESTV